MKPATKRASITNTQTMTVMLLVASPVFMLTYMCAMRAKARKSAPRKSANILWSTTDRVSSVQRKTVERVWTIRRGTATFSVEFKLAPNRAGLDRVALGHPPADPAIPEERGGEHPDHKTGGGAEPGDHVDRDAVLDNLHH